MATHPWPLKEVTSVENKTPPLIDAIALLSACRRISNESHTVSTVLSMMSWVLTTTKAIEANGVGKHPVLLLIE